MEREKVTLRFIIRFRIQWKRSGSLVFNDFVEPIIQENVASSVSVEKKNNLSFIEKKKNSDCADITKIKGEKIQIFQLNVISVCACDIAGCALNTLNLWRIRSCFQIIIYIYLHAKVEKLCLLRFVLIS